MKKNLSVLTLCISILCLYICMVTIITSSKMKHYHNLRMELWPKKESFEYSAKWFETAKWRDNMLFFLPSLDFENKDKSFNEYKK